MNVRDGSLGKALDFLDHVVCIEPLWQLVRLQMDAHACHYFVFSYLSQMKMISLWFFNDVAHLQCSIYVHLNLYYIVLGVERLAWLPPGACNT
eukprot:2214261-Amphidinium_carterae.1